MKTYILLGLFLTIKFSCKHHSNPVTNEDNFQTHEANRKKQETQGKAVLFCEAERFLNRYPKRNAIMKTL